MVTNQLHSELSHQEESPVGPKVVAGLLALIVTAAVFAGYIYFRNRQAQQNLAVSEQPQQSARVVKGPPKAHILVDEALLKGGQTIIGGSVKNISGETLSGLAVDLELKRRTGGATERMKVAVSPAQLEPDQEGRYTLKLPAQHFSSVRLVGLSGGADSALLSYTTGQGQKRPLERLEPKVVVVPRSSNRSEFLNSPDSPARVP